MRVLLLTLTLAAVALAGCTDDGDADPDANLGGLIDTPIIAAAGDILATVTFNEPVAIPAEPSQDELCQVGRIGLGEAVWTIPDVDPDTGAAWVASTMTVDVSAANAAAAGTGDFVVEIEGPDGSILQTVRGDAESEASAVLTDAEAGAYTFIIHACDSAAGAIDTVQGQADSSSASFQVDAAAEMAATETVYGEADGSASGSTP